MNGEDRERIARREADDTFDSITDLDSICDTNLIAITFLLTALSSWTAFAFEHFDRIRQSDLLFGVYAALVVLCALSIAASVTYHVKSLAPRGFYGEALGKPFLEHWWEIPTRGDTADADGYESRIADVSDAEELTAEFESWLDEYAPALTIDSAREFEIVRLFHYKAAARIKAKYTAYGVSLLRVSVALLVSVILLSVVGQLLLPAPGA